MDDVYPSDFIVHKGRKFRPPKYYDELLRRSRPELLEELQEKRRQEVNLAEQTEERRRARGKVHFARTSVLSRRP